MRLSRYLTVHGMLSGTGIRNSVEGGSLDPAALNLSGALRDDLAQWLRRYEAAHYAGYPDADEISKLDSDGLAIARRVSAELPESKVEYFSDARMTRSLVTGR